MKEIKLFQVDAFSNKPFKGNSAAVCLLEEELETELMQLIAAENNLAETAFVSRRDAGFSLRWFTPTVEVDLCGHATLATAHTLWEEKVLKLDEMAHFHTRSGLLKARKMGDWIELDFPVAAISPVEADENLLKAFDVEPIRVSYAENRFILEFASADEVKNLKPDFQILKNYDIIVVTARGNSGSGFDFVSRTFCPAFGIDEDPVTGSSHCGLTPYWADKLGKTELFAFQASSRGGELRLKTSGDRVLISGQAVTVIKGTFYI